MALRFLCLYIGWNLLEEILACAMALRYKNNLLIYTIMEPISMYWAVLYFNYGQRLFRKYALGWVTGTIGILGQGIFLFEYPEIASNTLFLQYECLCLVAFSLTDGFLIGKQQKMLDGLQQMRLCIAGMFLLFFAGSFFIRAAGSFAGNSETAYLIVHHLYIIIYGLGLLFYAGLGIAFLVFSSSKKRVP